MQQRNLARLLSPASIAVVGGRSAATVAAQCQRIGYSGELYAVHPTRSELAGITCVQSVNALPVPPDACFIGVSPERTVEVVADLAAIGAGGAVCYASGFAEAGRRGEQLQEALVSSAGEMPLVGPNCHGFINYLDGVALWPDHFGGERTDTGPALLMQSGNIAINVTFQQRELAFSYVVAMGNNAQLEIHDYLHAMLDDPRVTAIGLHLEGIRNVPEFTAAALRALRQRVPLVAMKSGSSSLGAEMALSHTRSLANPDDLVSVMFERYGVARCQSLSELLETLKFVATAGAITPRDGQQLFEPHIASMSCSGGEASHLADLAATQNLHLPELSEETSQKLSDLLGDRVHVSNPLDYHTYVWGDEPALTDVFTALLREPLDCALLILDYPPPDRYDVEPWQVAERALCTASRVTGTRVALVSSLPENLPGTARSRLLELGVAPMQGLLECVQAIKHAATIGRAQQFRDTLVAIRASSIATQESHLLNELDSKNELARYGLVVPKSAQCAVQDARSVAATIGFPLVMKALGRQLAHKTELGAVRVGVSTMDEVARHALELGQIGDALLIEEMVEDVLVELLVGVTHHDDFGQVLMLGAGGVNVEMMRDTVQVLLPATRPQLAAALSSLRVCELIFGYRGKAGDMEAVLDAVESICAYASANVSCLLELDVNPLIVRVVDAPVLDMGANKGHGKPAKSTTAGGQQAQDESITATKSDLRGAIAVDALIRIRAAPR